VPARPVHRPGLVVVAVSGLVLSALLLGSAAAAVQARAGPARACAGWRVVFSPSRGSSTLNAVAATSAKDAWAVGSHDLGAGSRTFIEHWNGSGWKVMPSPNPATGPFTTDTLGGVVALSRTNAWAFGFYEKTTTSFRTLIEHWNGVRWSVIPSPNSGTGENTLAAAVALTSTDIWAVGYRQDTTSPVFSARRTLVERWRGTRWRIVPSPDVGAGDNFLFGVAAASATQAWAVGSDSVSFGRTLAMRWSGTAWSVAPTPSRGQGDRFLQAVAAPSPRFALAVGSDLNGSQTQTLSERWTGSAWSLVRSPSPAADFNSLQAVAALSARNAWAVGARRTDLGASFSTLAEHWNGSTWTVTRSPSPGRGDDWLFGASAVPRGGGFWAVGAAGASTLIEFRC
jgi:hypothetical protein